MWGKYCWRECVPSSNASPQKTICARYHIGLALLSSSCRAVRTEASLGHHVHVAEGLPKPRVLFQAGCKTSLFGKVSKNRWLYMLLAWDLLGDELSLDLAVMAEDIVSSSNPHASGRGCMLPVPASWWGGREGASDHRGNVGQGEVGRQLCCCPDVGGHRPWQSSRLAGKHPELKQPDIGFRALTVSLLFKWHLNARENPHCLALPAGTYCRCCFAVEVGWTWHLSGLA